MKHPEVKACSNCQPFRRAALGFRGNGVFLVVFGVHRYVVAEAILDTGLESQSRTKTSGSTKSPLAGTAVVTQQAAQRCAGGRCLRAQNSTASSSALQGGDCRALRFQRVLARCSPPCDGIRVT